MDKIILRKNVLKTRDELLREDQLSRSYEIMEKTVGHYEFIQAEEVLLYASYKSEVITDGIMEYAFMLGKKVYCPKVIANGVQSEMEFFQMMYLDHMTHYLFKGSFMVKLYIDTALMRLTDNNNRCIVTFCFFD